MSEQPSSLACESITQACCSGDGWEWLVVKSGCPALLISAAAAAVLYVRLGPTLWLLLGGMALAALLAPGLVAAERSMAGKLLAALGVIDGIALIWLWAALHSQITSAQWLACCLVLTAWVAALMGMVMFLGRLRFPAAAAAALTVILAMLWMSWPFWMAPRLSGQHDEKLVNRLVIAHPLFAVNVPVRGRGHWLESQGVAYWATNLNQDVFYTPPRSIWPCVALHMAIAVVGARVVRRSHAARTLGI